MESKTNKYFGKTVEQWKETEIGVVHKYLGGRRANRINFPRMMRAFEGQIDFLMPKNLLCIAGHNYEGDTVFEEQMEIHSQPPEAYAVVHFNKERTTPWSHFLRWKKIVSYMKKAEDKEYVLCMDPTDCLFIDSPHNILNNFLTKFDCDILFNSTTYFRGYRWDLQSEEACEYHKSKRHKFRAYKHLNGGICIGRREAVVELYERVLSYELNSRGERVEPADPGAWYNDPEFPYGCADDQKVLRHIEYENYPKMQIDGRNKLFIRVD